MGKQVEASTRFELVHDGFADRSLTAWVRRLNKLSVPRHFDNYNAQDMEAFERKIGFEPTTLTLATLCSTN